MSKHTPGPWSAAAGYGNHGRAVHSESGMNIAVVFHVDCDIRGLDGRITGQEIDPERFANACLIAAAPELLDACNVAMGHLTGGMDGDWRDCDPIELLRIAIAKATPHQNEGKQ